jgi:hypothetical protein
MFGFPLTARVGDLYVTLTEALVKDYGDLAVKLGTDGALEGQLYADPQGWPTDDPVTQPWRVTIIARNLTDLVNTTLVQNLNPPDLLSLEVSLGFVHKTGFPNLRASFRRLTLLQRVRQSDHS